MSEPVQVALNPEEYAEDLDLRLGRANGNIYIRRTGLEGVHDGQVMVRLKKKRYVILDYSIVPNEADIAFANSNPHMSIPNGAGKTSCSNTDCNKVGVPVLLYDSEPNEPASLYMRSGLCFTCQRNLNEKRRTVRKRPSDAAGSDRDPNSVFGSSKKQRHNSEAIILHPMTGVKRHADGYSFTDIGVDLQRSANEVASDTNRLVNAVCSTTDTSTADLAATAAAVAASVQSELAPDDAATNAAVNSASGLLPDASNGKGNEHEHDVEEHATNPVDINALYDKAYSSMSRSIFLLSQWKTSWDAAIAAAVAQESIADHGLADAVASAAAVAAAASEGQNSNVASLLLAADDTKKEHGKSDEDDDAHEDATKIESYEV